MRPVPSGGYAITIRRSTSSGRFLLKSSPKRTPNTRIGANDPMNVLVTGGCGFIGSAVVRAFAGRGNDVTVADIPGANRDRIGQVADRVRMVDLDVTDHTAASALVKAAKPDTVVHLAWYAVPGKYPSSTENVPFIGATLNLMQASAEAGVKKFVGIGTCFEYDFETNIMREDSPTKPSSLYAACKLATFTAATKLAEMIELPMAWVRFFYQYGPWEDERRLVASVIRKLLMGEKAQASTGEQVRDFLHVGDDASGVLAVLDSDLTGAVNVGSGVPVTVRQIVETIGRLTGRGELIELGAYQPRVDDPPMVVADNGRLREATGWLPQYDLESGLAETVEWWGRRLKESGELR
ncbi:MAG: NAD(P)-dependent oxidoreductase [bacterium]